MRRAALATVFATFALAVPTGAAAAPADRDTALAQYQAVLEDERVAAGWTGSVNGCVVGEESEASLAATLRTVNTLRTFAGVGPVTFDPALNQRALAAALMMKAAGDLSHTPGPEWPCYSEEGAEGAGTANLFLGASGAAAAVGYVDDSGVPSLGHRRWLIDPSAVQFGSGSTGTTNALVVFGSSSAPVPSGTTVAWPPAGWVPWAWIFKTWSISLGGDLDQGAFITSGAQVQVTLDGDPLPVSNVQTLEDGYGTGRTLSWDVGVPGSAQSANHELKVTIDGVTRGGAPFPISYATNAFVAPDPAKCAKARAKLDRAKKKLKKLRSQDADRNRIAKAKKKVKAAKEAAAAVC
jgi:uncharacterized protein YkwD